MWGKEKNTSPLWCAFLSGDMADLKKKFVVQCASCNECTSGLSHCVILCHIEAKSAAPGLSLWIGC